MIYCADIHTYITTICIRYFGMEFLRFLVRILCIIIKSARMSTLCGHPCRLTFECCIGVIQVYRLCHEEFQTMWDGYILYRQVVVLLHLRSLEQ